MGKWLFGLIVGFLIMGVLAVWVGDRTVYDHKIELAQAQAVQAQAETSKVQAETVLYQVKASAAAAAREALMYQFMLVVVLIWSAVLVGALVFVLLGLYKRQNAQALYLPRYLDPRQLQPGESLTLPQWVPSNKIVTLERGR